MAKGKLNTSTTTTVNVDKPVVKTEGIIYIVTAEHDCGRGMKIPASFILKECTDGFYQVCKPDGSKHSFRIGKLIVDQVNKTTVV